MPRLSILSWDGGLIKGATHPCPIVWEPLLCGALLPFGQQLWVGSAGNRRGTPGPPGPCRAVRIAAGQEALARRSRVRENHGLGGVHKDPIRAQERGEVVVLCATARPSRALKRDVLRGPHVGPMWPRRLQAVAEIQGEGVVIQVREATRKVQEAVIGCSASLVLGRGPRECRHITPLSCAPSWHHRQPAYLYEVHQASGGALSYKLKKHSRT